MEMDQTLETFLEEYARRTNTHTFDLVAPLIAEKAVYWFTDGTFRGHSSIRHAFERTWSVIQDEQYSISEVEWLSVDTHSATCIYTFHWRGLINSAIREGSGRGTSVLQKVDGGWQVLHEHLSQFPG
jgi:ketosteroid isomerase-like protein